MKAKHNRSRPIKKEFFIDSEELKIIKERMAEHNLLNFSDYARKMLVFGEVKVIDFEELRRFRQEVRRIGLNINQVAKQVNTDDDVSLDQLTTLLSEVKELNRQMNDLLKKEERQARES